MAELKRRVLPGVLAVAAVTGVLAHTLVGLVTRQAHLLRRVHLVGVDLAQMLVVAAAAALQRQVLTAQRQVVALAVLARHQQLQGHL